jgi:hypothetical protein
LIYILIFRIQALCISHTPQLSLITPIDEPILETQSPDDDDDDEIINP